MKIREGERPLVVVLWIWKDVMDEVILKDYWGYFMQLMLGQRQAKIVQEMWKEFAKK